MSRFDDPGEGEENVGKEEREREDQRKEGGSQTEQDVVLKTVWVKW